LYKLTLYEKAKVAPQPRVSLSDLVYIFLAGPPLLGGTDKILHRGPKALSAALLISEFRTKHNIVAKYNAQTGHIYVRDVSTNYAGRIMLRSNVQYNTVLTTDRVDVLAFHDLTSQTTMAVAQPFSVIHDRWRAVVLEANGQEIVFRWGWKVD
jgi:hypothetical protein